MAAPHIVVAQGQHLTEVAVGDAHPCSRSLSSLQVEVLSDLGHGKVALLVVLRVTKHLLRGDVRRNHVLAQLQWCVLKQRGERRDA